MPASFLQEGEQAKVFGEIVSTPVIDGDRLRLDLKVEKLNLEKKRVAFSGETIRLIVRLCSLAEKRQGKQYQSGDRILAFVTFKRPSPAHNPGGLDYREHLKHQGIHWIGNTASLSTVQIIEPKIALHAQLLARTVV